MTITFANFQIEHLVAGTSGGLVSTLCLHPLDLVKVRFQVSDGQSDGRPRYKGTIDAFQTIYRSEGWRGLYKGLTANLWGAGMSWGLYFYWYNTIKSAIQQSSNRKSHEMSAAHHLTAAALAGTVTLVFTNPIWVVKTRMCLQYTHPYSTDHYLGMRDALLKIYRNEGIAGFYKGFLPGLLGVSHGALQFMAYEQLKQHYMQFTGLPQFGRLGSLEYLLLAAISKIFSSVTTYPLQVLRSRLQDKQTKYIGMLDVVVRTYRNEGLLGFYKGLVPNVIRVTPATCIIFVVYENVRFFLERTG